LHFLSTVESATFKLLLQEPKLYIILFCFKSEMVLPYLITRQEPNFYWGGIFKAICQLNKWATVKAVVNIRLIFMANETLFIENPPYNRHL